jgi:hypothetical protein
MTKISNKCEYCEREYEHGRIHILCCIHCNHCWLRVNDTCFTEQTYSTPIVVKPTDDLLRLLIGEADPLSVTVLKIPFKYDLSNIDSLEPLRSLVNLQCLVLWSGSITSLEPLRGLTELVRLDLSHNRITSLEPIRDLTNLTSLNLGYNQISDLEPIRRITKMTQLCLGKNQISDSEPISGFINVHYCDLGDNEISNIEPLLNMIYLKWYFIDNCTVCKTDKKKVFDHMRTSLMKIDYA